ncbi:MAG TPA: M48 family metalloprotease [Candidatus Binatia bacterium]
MFERRFHLLLILLIAGCAYLPFSSRAPVAHAIQEDEETKISRQFRREARKQLRLVANPEVEAYVDRIGRRILSVMGPQQFEYRFFVVEDSQLNAFSVPGGSIYVYTGLLDRVKNTGEIAGVLGHEIIHAKDHHLARLSGPDPIAILGLLGMILARGGAAAQAAGALSQGLAATRMLTYSRQLELEADTLGVRYMAQAGYDPKDALGFMKTLEQQKTFSSDIPPYLLTHPVSGDRVANVELIIRSLPAERPRSDGPDPLKRIQTLLRLERHEEEEVVREYERQAQKNSDDAEARHLLALGQFFQGKLTAARENFEKARALDPKRPGIDRDLGKLYGQMGEFQLAHEAFDRAIRGEPREAVNYLSLGELYERENNLRDAAGAYFNATNLAPLSPVAFYRLGVTYGRMNRQADGHYYLARSFLLQDDDARAVADYERAIKILGPTSPRGQMIKEELDTLKARGK